MTTQNEKPDKATKRSLEEILREAWLGALGTLERRVDEGVRLALTKLATPLHDEIAALSQRLDRLAARLDEQARRRATRRERGEVGASEETTTTERESGPANEPTDGMAR